jgi:hypothetical protein
MVYLIIEFLPVLVLEKIKLHQEHKIHVLVTLLININLSLNKTTAALVPHLFSSKTNNAAPPPLNAAVLNHVQYHQILAFQLV